MIFSKKICLKTPVNPIILGKFGSAYSIYGWIKIFSFTEYPEDIFKYKPWFIQYLNKWQLIELENWKYYKENILIKIKHIDNRNIANLVVNYKIIVDSFQMPILKNNEYYWKDLIGCQVINTEGYNLGYVNNLIETGSNDVLVIKANINDLFGIKNRLIPFIYKKVIKNINIFTKNIKVDWDPKF